MLSFQGIALSSILLFLSPFTTSLSLDTKTKYWGYTTSSLANTTSQKCKDAYSADIACDDFLAGIVNANEMRGFLPDMEYDNFTLTCTATCHSSLLDWIANLEDKCDQPGDAALRGVGHRWREMEFEPIPVVTVGRIFEYTLMRACAEDEDGENCYITESSVLASDFHCSWTCAAAYYWNQHLYPYSDWEFGTVDGDVEIEIDEDGDLWEYNKWNHILVEHPDRYNMSGEGWQTIVDCGFDKGDVPFGTGIEGVTAKDELKVFDRNRTRSAGNEEDEEKEEIGSVSASASEGESESESANVTVSNGTSTSSDPEDGGAARFGVAGGCITVAVLVFSFVYL
ncbi:hypothetical protein BJY01DRAFT_121116 [Aspergillus pseudoustus]|uniref:Uncharacterized protein n=1 Tax=Aspergillus pseudoustus TaxID=1810923 RepID=A0ABR4IR95_9EURO